MIKRWVCYLFLLILLFSCEKNDYVIKGVYEDAKDGTVIYMSPYLAKDLNGMLVPVDSSVVKDGCFEFKGTSKSAEIFFIHSSRILDGGFVVVEPGRISLDMAERTFRGGTENNEQLNRYLNEKERIIAIRGMCEPGILNVIAATEEARDSVVKMSSLAGLVFDMYVSKAIDENINNCLGHFFLTQSVGIASPDALIPFVERVPVEMHDIMFESKKRQLNNLLDKKSMLNSYMLHADRIVRETSVGRKYVNFELDNIAGGKILFSDVIRASEYTLLCFWGSWNDGSLSFLKELSELSRGYKSKGLELVTVSMDASTDDCKDTVSANNLYGIHLCNPGGGSAEVASAYGVFDLPYLLLVNSSGTIILRTVTVADVLRKLEEIF